MKKSATKINQSLAVALVQEDWDFAACPNDELFACAFYEYARNSVFWNADVATRRKLPTWGGVETELKDWAKPENQKFSFLMFRAIRAHRDLLRLFPEYPQKPWLKIQSSKRQKRLKLLTAGLMTSVPILHEVPVALLRESKADQDLQKLIFPKNLTHVFNCSVIPFAICWDFTDATLVREFERWLKTARRSPEPAKHRGRTATEPEVLRARLRDLGAMRLLEHLSVNEALTYTKQHSNGGTSLHGTVRSWRRANQNATKLLTRFGRDGFPVENATGPDNAIEFLLGTSMMQLLKNTENPRQNAP